METNQIIVTLVTVALLLLLYYLATYEKKKQEKEIRKMQENLKEGDKIISYTGLTGIIKEVLDDRVIILLNPNKMEVSLEKWAIAGLDERNIYEANAKEDKKETEEKNKDK